MAKTYLITGANRGIGLELARQLAARDERVIATARAPERAGELGALGVQTEALDVASPESVSALAQRLDGESIDVLVNNAGIGVGGRSFEDANLEEMLAFFSTNSIGPLRVTQALLPNLRKGSKRHVVSITSKMGSIDDNTSGGAYAYRASKSALNMANKSLSLDLAGEGFVCVVLHPGWVQTDMGGGGAPITPAESVAGMLRVIDGLEPGRSGGFFDFEGKVVPW